MEDNRVTLAEDKDQFGLPVAKITFNMKENDKKIAAAGTKQTKEILLAAGATEVDEEARYAHLIGGARMGNDPRTSVVDSFGRTHDIPNLFLCDGSIFPTQGSANPGLTIQAVAARTADFLVSEREFASQHHPRTTSAVPRIRYDLSPGDTAGHGMPRLKSQTPRAEVGIGGLAPDSDF